jgi:hypothetical protein
LIPSADSYDIYMSHNVSVERLLRSIDASDLDYLEVFEERAVEDALRSWALLRSIVRILTERANVSSTSAGGDEEAWGSAAPVRHEDRR